MAGDVGGTLIFAHHVESEDSPDRRSMRGGPKGHAGKKGAGNMAAHVSSASAPFSTWLLILPSSFLQRRA